MKNAGLLWLLTCLWVGADDGTWWSMTELTRPPVPAGEEGNVVDRFVRAKQRELGLEKVEEADRRTLARRLAFNLWGMPLALRRVEDFVRDERPEAYRELVDELLASSRYGERWARHWMDLVHFGETHGYDKDQPRENAWPYRDYLIRSFNGDKPFTRFVKEQIAGDVLWPATEDGVVAPGFLASGPWDLIGHAEVPESKIDGKVARHLDRDDMVMVTMNTFCSLTVQCAQCHDHKADPVTMNDYYSLQAVFAALDRADREYDLDPKVAGKRASLKSERRDLAQQIGEFSQVIEEAKTDEIRELKERQKVVEQLIADLPEPRKAFVGMVHHGSGNFMGRGSVGGKPREIHVLNRGSVTQPTELVRPGTVPGIAPGNAEFALNEDHSEGDRRVALAEWIVHPENKLTWRSIVNRVWQWHFGEGLVTTANDFGRIGEKPSHPELLDWLAVEFRDGGGSLKELHRLILNSETYRQSSMVDAGNAETDTFNRYLWRQNRRRLEAEEVRDTILWASGKMDFIMGGPSFRDFVIEKPEHSPHYQYHLADPDDPATHRRSVYRFLVRSQSQPLMEALDCADPSMLVDKRGDTTTSLQALAMMNNAFVIRMAEHFAKRVEGEEDVVGKVIGLALGRDASDGERSLLGKYADDHGIAAMCRVVFNLSEFSYVD